MKVFIVLCALVAFASAGNVKTAKPTKDPFADFANDPHIALIKDDDDRPPTTFTGNVQQAQITSLENSNHGQGKFNYNFETQNGINIAQIGKLRDDKTFVVSGSYSYTGADGRRYRVRYTADELGYHPITELEEIEFPEIVIPPKKTTQSLSFQSNLNLNGQNGIGNRNGVNGNGLNNGLNGNKIGNGLFGNGNANGLNGNGNNGVNGGNLGTGNANGLNGNGKNGNGNGNNLGKTGGFELISVNKKDEREGKNLQDLLNNNHINNKNDNSGVNLKNTDDVLFNLNFLGVSGPSKGDNVLMSRLYLPAKPSEPIPGHTKAYLPPKVQPQPQPQPSKPIAQQTKVYLPPKVQPQPQPQPSKPIAQQTKVYLPPKVQPQPQPQPSKPIPQQTKVYLPPKPVQKLQPQPQPQPSKPIPQQTKVYLPPKPVQKLQPQPQPQPSKPIPQQTKVYLPPKPVQKLQPQPQKPSVPSVRNVNIPLPVKPTPAFSIDPRVNLPKLQPQPSKPIAVQTRLTSPVLPKPTAPKQPNTYLPPPQPKPSPSIVQPSRAYLPTQ